MVWQFVVGAIISIAATYLLRPKPQTQPPAAFDDIEVPVAEEGKEIPVLFGCKMLRGPNVVWYGDLKTEPIRTKGGKK